MATGQSSEEYLLSKKKDLENLELQIETVRAEMKANLQARRVAVQNDQFDEFDRLEEEYKELDTRFMRAVAQMKEIHRYATELEEAETSVDSGPSADVEESTPRSHVPVPEVLPEKPESSSNLEIDPEHEEDPERDV